MRLMRGLKTIHVASLKTKPSVSRNVRAFPAHTHTSHIPWYRSPLWLAGACLTTPDADACAQTNLTPDMREDLS